jgi:hypothetical protein
MKNLILIALLLLCLPANAETGKRDILGFKPGMSLGEVQALAKQKGYTCQSLPKAITVYCRTSSGELNLMFALSLDAPVFGVSLKNIETGNFKKASETVSQQFGVQPYRTLEYRDGSIEKYFWQLSTGEIIVLTADSLELTDAKYIAQVINSDRTKKDAKQMPKF